MARLNDLFTSELEVINIGLESFHQSLTEAGGQSIHVKWEPPAGVDTDLNQKLTRLARHQDQIQTANQEAADRITGATPLWTDVIEASDVIPEMQDERLLLHAGPPIDWEAMSGPQRGAVLGAALYEEWASDPESAEAMAAQGEIQFAPAHHYRAVGPMAGVISPSMPLVVVENSAHGNQAYSNLNEGLGKVLRFGAYSEEVLERLHWMKTILAPILREAVTELEGINLKLIVAKALQMGDETHNRNVAATSLIARTLLPALVKVDASKEDLVSVAQYLEVNDHFFLNFSMAAAKAAADAAAGIPWSTIVTAMARNGTEFGIRVSGLDDLWLTCPAPEVEGLYFPGYTQEDANPDIGDSTICETVGLGGFAMAAAPAITEFVGGTPAEALTYTREMYEITIKRNSAYTLPTLGFQGTPTGIDCLQVLDTGIYPVINTGIAHKEPGVGQVGAGVTRAPQACFVKAAEAFVDRYSE